MAVLTEVEHISSILDQATFNQGVNKVVGEQPVPVARIDEGVDLVYGSFPYQQRAKGVDGRRLIGKSTTQPVLAVREKARFVPLPYAEDVIRHPLRRRLEEILETLSVK